MPQLGVEIFALNAENGPGRIHSSALIGIATLISIATLIGLRL